VQVVQVVQAVVVAGQILLVVVLLLAELEQHLQFRVIMVVELLGERKTQAAVVALVLLVVLVIHLIAVRVEMVKHHL
jgi:hypothetical protein